ncbi:MAG: hypothetical protein R2726_15770 [Acidimicrobiales bacterium]
MRILVVCTGNVCRSPMAEAMLRARLAARGVAASVSSAGTATEDRPASDEVLELLAPRGLDGSGHRSRLIEPVLLGDADLVLAMARLHVRDATLVDPSVFGRTFTLKELVRRGTATGPRGADERLASWLARVGDDRLPTALLGDSPADDLADPVGRRFAVFKKLAAELDDLLDALVDLAWPVGPDGRPATPR